MSNAKIGILVIFVTALVTYLGFTKDIPLLNEPYEVKAAFRDTRGIKPNTSPVRIGGVEVGTVRKVEPTTPGAQSGTVTFSVLDKGRPVHADATAKIRPRIFLEGNFYIDLSVGTPEAPEMKANAIIPAERTASPVQFDQVLQALKSDTRAELRRTLTELGDTQRAGGGQAFNRSQAYQADAYKFSAIVSEAFLGEQPGDLSRWIDNSGIVAGALDRSPERLQSLITDFNTTMRAFADREGELRAAVDELPETMDAALPAFTDLDAAFPSVRAFARAARPGVRSTGPAAKASLPLLRQLRGLVSENELRGLSRDLRGTVPSLTSLARTSVPLLEEFRELASCTSEVLVPWGDLRVPDDMFPATGPVHQEGPKGLVGLGGESRSFDANTQWFKVLGSGGVETFDLGEGQFGTGSRNVGINPPPDESRPPLRPDVPCETNEVTNLDTNPQQPRRAEGVDPNAPEVLERIEDAREVALATINTQLQETAGIAAPNVGAIDTSVTLPQLRERAADNGLMDQLNSVNARETRLAQTLKPTP